MLGNRRTRDVERLTGRRGDTTQRAILWNELEALATKLGRFIASPEYAGSVADMIPPDVLNDHPTIREVNQTIDSTNTFIENEAARLDGVLSGVRTDLEAADTALNSTIDGVRTDLEAADVAIEQNLSNLTVRVGTAEADITSTQTALASGDAALAEDITALTARVGTAEADITSTQTALASGDAALASDITALSVRVDDAEAAVTAEQIARSDGDTALAQDITTVEANLAAASASVTQNSSAIATIESYQAATYSLRVDAGDAQGSLELVAADDPINGPRSAVRIKADNILLDGTVFAHHIDVASLAADTGFINTLTAEQAFIDSIEVGDASITSAKIASLDAGKITTGVLNASRINIDNVTLTASGGSLFVKDAGIGTFKIQPSAVTAGGASTGATLFFTGVSGATVIIWGSVKEFQGNANTTASLVLNGSARASITLSPSSNNTWMGSGTASNGTNSVALSSPLFSTQKLSLAFIVLKR